MTDSNPTPLNLAIIGTGLAVEKLHWPALKQMPDRFQITAFSNHSRPNAKNFAAYSGSSMDAFLLSIVTAAVFSQVLMVAYLRTIGR